MTTLGALIMLFHPTEAGLGRVAALAQTCDALAVVDNAASQDPRLTQLAQRKQVILLHKGNRYGCAAAFNLGLAALFAPGCQGVALFDQECKNPAPYFPLTTTLCERMGSRAFLAGPGVFNEVERSFRVEVTTDGIAVRRLRLCKDEPMQRCAFLSSWGCLISHEASERLGRFDEQLFADHVDTEYSLRALARAVPLFLVPALVLSRGARDAQPVADRAWPQRYYSARNAMHLSLSYGLRFPVALVTSRHITSQIAHILLHEHDKWARLYDIVSGVVDGVLCRLGPLETVRPRVAARRARHL